jgi:MYXO-CTERM domain-containing protein
MNNSRLENADLVLNDHDAVASTIASIATSLAGSLGGAIPNIALDDLLGGIALPGGMALPINISLPDDALWPVEQLRDDSTTERFLGIFIDLSPATPPTALSARAETSVEVTSVTLPEDKTGFNVHTFQQGPAPTVEIAMSATGPEGAEYEYSYRLTNTGWSEWSSSPYAVIQDPSLFMQQWHTVYARARIKGVPHSVDYTTAKAQLLIDADEPIFEVSEVNGAIMLQAHDVITAIEDVEYRYRNPGSEEWSEWTTFDDADPVELDGATADVEVEVRDTNGNVATNVQALRGLPAPGASGGCGSCAVGATESNGNSPLALFGTAFILGLALVRRRRR